MLGGLCPVFMGVSVGFAEFYLLKTLGFIPLDCNKGHSASVSSFLPLCLPLNRLFFLCSSSPFFSVSNLLVSLFMKGDVKKPLWTEDLNCQHLDYNRAHFQEVPFAENFSKMVPSLGNVLEGAPSSPSLLLSTPLHCALRVFGPPDTF